VIDAQRRALCETSRLHYDLVINSCVFAFARAQIPPRTNAENGFAMLRAKRDPLKSGDEVD
jgi:hypothetical protein